MQDSFFQFFLLFLYFSAPHLQRHMVLVLADVTAIMLAMVSGQISLFVVLFMTQMFHSITSKQCRASIHSIFQMMLRGHTFMTIEGRQGAVALKCREACHADFRCQSYNIVILNSKCELNNRTKEARPEDFVKDKDRYYMASDSKRGKRTYISIRNNRFLVQTSNNYLVQGFYIGTHHCF